MRKWEEISELKVQYPKVMIQFSAKDLTWKNVKGSKVAIIPYSRLNDFISGEQSIEDAPTQFVVKTRRVKEVEEIKHARVDTYLEYAIYWCAYGPETGKKAGKIDMNTPQWFKKRKRSPRESIKVGCTCHFIMRRLYSRPQDVVIIYNTPKHVDRFSIVCHGKDVVGRPQSFNYAPHLSKNIRDSVAKMIEDGFNVTMIWDKFISDVEHGSGELFTGVTRDALMTRKDILNIYNSIRRQEDQDRRWTLCKKNDGREEGTKMQNTQNHSNSSSVVVETEGPTRRLILDLNLPSPLDNYDQKLLQISS